MRIQHNISAMNAYRNYSNNNSALSKNLEKLSSGYKINRAGDDAAGLAISEKMRAQIAGLDQAQSNAKSGVNLVQTAEGALTEVHDMLNRMVTLADQSANGTYDNDTDRPNLQAEVEQLQKEIDRIADSSNFNGINLLDGSMSGVNVGGITYAANSIKNVEVSGGKLTGIAQEATAFQVGLNTAGTITVQNGSTAAAGVTWKVKGTAGNGAASATQSADSKGGVYTFEAVVDKTTATAEDAELYEGMTVTVTVDGAMTTGNNAGQWTAATAADAALTKGTGMTLQIGDTSDDFNQLTIDVQDMHTSALGIDSVNVLSQGNAQDAVQKIKDAINTVSSVRGKLGASQNRLEHTMNNLSVMSENITDAESNIRDTDVAAEMMKYTKNNILVQSAQAMLAQANQSPQGVLQLLQ